MIHLILFLSFLLMPFCQIGAADTTAYNLVLERENGFRGVVLGAKLKSIPDLELQYEYQCGATYAKKKENFSIGTAKLDSITYEFYRDRLAEISLWAPSGIHALSLLSELKKVYGEPVTLSNGVMVWEAAKSYLLYRKLEDGTANAVFLYKELKAELARARKRGDYLP